MMINSVEPVNNITRRRRRNHNQPHGFPGFPPCYYNNGERIVHATDHSGTHASTRFVIDRSSHLIRMHSPIYNGHPVEPRRCQQTPTQSWIPETDHHRRRKFTWLELKSSPLLTVCIGPPGRTTIMWPHSASVTMFTATITHWKWPSKGACAHRRAWSWT